MTSSSVDPYYNSKTPKGVSPLGTLSLPEAMVEVVDAGPKAALAVEPLGLVIKEGDTKTIKVTLTSRPLYNTSVTVVCADLNGGKNTGIKTNVMLLVFKPEQWNTAQDVNVQAIEDTLDEPFDELYTITFNTTSNDLAYVIFLWYISCGIYFLW